MARRGAAAAPCWGKTCAGRARRRGRRRRSSWRPRGSSSRRRGRRRTGRRCTSSGESADGAYYVTSHFPRSVEQLIDAGARPTSAELQALLGQVVQGLIDLETSLARPHGDLKPSNVLLRHSRVDCAGLGRAGRPAADRAAHAAAQRVRRPAGGGADARVAGRRPRSRRRAGRVAGRAVAGDGRRRAQRRRVARAVQRPAEPPPAGGVRAGGREGADRGDRHRQGPGRKRSRLPVGLAAAAGVAAVAAVPLWIYVVRPRIANSAWLGRPEAAGRPDCADALRGRRRRVRPTACSPPAPRR